MQYIGLLKLDMEGLKDELSALKKKMDSLEAIVQHTIPTHSPLPVPPTVTIIDTPSPL